MSSARKRRADIQANPPAPNKVVPPPAPARGAAPANIGGAAGAGAAGALTLQQIINITDRRLSALETAIQKGAGGGAASSATVVSGTALAQETIDEIYSRFDILLGEVAELKDTVMKLQTFTMDVNRTLFEERRQNETREETSDDVVDNDAVVESTAEDNDAAAESTAENDDDTQVADTPAGKRAAARRVRGGGLRVNL